ncbi:MAG TPA: transketolase C-terminal domain-containing protein [Bacteroidales bacterium]|nr:transketolase C-terminal domain-containing protein [Bacteroidales bacterium]
MEKLNISLSANSGNKDTRSGFGDALFKLGQERTEVVALSADLTGSLKMDKFAKTFPDRFFQIGIAEANMMCIAAGLATGGKIPFTGTFANFSTGRVFDQIRQSIAYSEKNVKICASHAGITLGEDGASHQIMEDIALMKSLPGITVINPCDYNQTYAATLAVADHEGAVYLRFGRPKVPNFTPPDHKFVIGQALLMREGSDVTIFATGHMVWKALEAADALNKNGISAEVINIATIKPLDREAIMESILKTRCAVTAEEHQIYGGMGESIAGFLARNFPTPVEMVGMNDVFGESGTPDELMEKFGMDTHHIIEAATLVLARKQY